MLIIHLNYNICQYIEKKISSLEQAILTAI